MSARDRIQTIPQRHFPVKVTATHIDRMYDRFDSGMADHSTQNGIVLALREIFGAGVAVRTVKLCRDEWGVLLNHDSTIPLPHVANQWMKLLCDGYLVAPMDFELDIPAPGRSRAVVEGKREVTGAL